MVQFVCFDRTNDDDDETRTLRGNRGLQSYKSSREVQEAIRFECKTVWYEFEEFEEPTEFKTHFEGVQRKKAT